MILRLVGAPAPTAGAENLRRAVRGDSDDEIAARLADVVDSDDSARAAVAVQLIAEQEARAAERRNDVEGAGEIRLNGGRLAEFGVADQVMVGPTAERLLALGLCADAEEDER